MAKWFSKVDGIDYEEIFSPVVMYSSIISILALAAYMGCKIHQMDVWTTFFNGLIEEKMYNEQLKRFETFDKETSVQTQVSIVLSQTSTLCLVHQDRQLSH